MNESSPPGTDQDRVQAVLDVLLRLAAADLDARLPTPEGDEPLDLIAAAVNMLADELSASITNERRLRSELEQEVAKRTAELEALERARALVAQQTQAIRELSTPVIEIWAGILVLPLIGIIDARRGEQVMEQLLPRIAETGARVTIIDLTGVPTIDEVVAAQLLKVASASRLLGAHAILTGINPTNAQTLVQLEVGFDELETASTLKAGLIRALAAAME